MDIYWVEEKVFAFFENVEEWIKFENKTWKKDDEPLQFKIRKRLRNTDWLQMRSGCSYDRIGKELFIKRFLRHGQTLNSALYCEQLTKLQQALQSVNAFTHSTSSEILCSVVAKWWEVVVHVGKLSYSWHIHDRIKKAVSICSHI